MDNKQLIPIQRLLEEIKAQMGGGTTDTFDYLSTPYYVLRVNANTVGVAYATAGIRLNTTVEVSITDISNMIATSDDVIYALIKNPTIANESWTAINGDVDSLDVDNENNPSTVTITGGTLVKTLFTTSGFAGGGAQFNTVESILLEQNDVYVLAVVPTQFGANADAFGAINFKIKTN